MGMDPVSWQKLLRKFGKLIQEKLAAGEPVGIPWVGSFYVRHIYGKPVNGIVVPHLGRPKFQFSTTVKKSARNAPNKGTPSELRKLKSKPVEAPSTTARRRQEFPGGYYLNGVGALAGVGQTGLGPAPSRRRTTRAQTGFPERMTELGVKRRFKVALKRAAKAAG